jgi:serine/threonine protein kinase
MKTSNCMPRETLKQYLAGWIDESRTSEIEQHLAACEACEQTVLELEQDPDTFCELLRGGGLAQRQSPEGDSVIHAAVARAIQLVDRESGPGERNPLLTQPSNHFNSGSVGAYSWGSNDETAARFRREIRAAGRLNHPSIVSATDAGEKDGTHYLVMEFIEGMDLSRIARLTNRSI